MTVVSKCQAEGGHQEPSAQEETRQERLQWFLWDLLRAAGHAQLRGDVDLHGIQRVGGLAAASAGRGVLLLVRGLYEGRVLHVRVAAVRLPRRGQASLCRGVAVGAVVTVSAQDAENRGL